MMTRQDGVVPSKDEGWGLRATRSEELNKPVLSRPLMEISFPRLPEPIAFRFFADFNIKIQPKETAGFTTQQGALLRTIATSPATLRRIALMRLQTDLSGITGSPLSDLFSGPDVEQILECILPFLSESETSYWEELRDGPGDTLNNELMPVFLAFEATLRRAGIEELQAECEPLRKSVGPTLDARDLPESENA